MVPRPPSVVPLNTINWASLFDRLFLSLALPSIIHPSSFQMFYRRSRTLMDILSLIPRSLPKKWLIWKFSDDEVMVSFDVVSLFTAIPVNKACEYIRDKLNNDNTLHLRTSLNTDEIISLLEFILSNNYFVYNNCIYKQIHGCAMGSPVSPIVANLCMEVIEELAISTSSVPPKVWKRYVDDSFVIIKKDAVSSFHNTLNASDPKISFTIELENNGQIAFLDTLVSRRNGVVVIDVYRKPTHTDRYLDFSCHHDKNTKSAQPRPFCFGHLAYPPATKKKYGKPATS